MSEYEITVISPVLPVGRKKIPRDISRNIWIFLVWFFPVFVFIYSTIYRGTPEHHSAELNLGRSVMCGSTLLICLTKVYATLTYFVHATFPTNLISVIRSCQ